MMSADSDCSICLQKLIHPVQLPCLHVFCFLCIKGCAFHHRRCPMCRARFSIRFFDDPKLLIDSTLMSLAKSTDEIRSAVSPSSTSEETPVYSWFYEGYNGWWQYDERTCDELEQAFLTQSISCEISIAGFIYSVDFQTMSQKRKDNSGRSRRIKRDLASSEKKGVAGIKLSTLQTHTSADPPTGHSVRGSTSVTMNGPQSNPSPACSSSAISSASGRPSRQSTHQATLAITDSQISHPRRCLSITSSVISNSLADQMENCSLSSSPATSRVVSTSSTMPEQSSRQSARGRVRSSDSRRSTRSSSRH